jgi:ubiquinone/menaquinone biosynthesis C-methylase UbiE
MMPGEEPGTDATTDEQVAELARRYSERAPAYDEIWSPVIQPFGEKLLAHMAIADAVEIVDVGTGAGALLPLIQRAAPKAQILGVDRSEGMLKLARGRHHGALTLMDAQNLDLADGRFDAAIVAFVLFHLPDPARCVREVHRVLKARGMVGTTTWGVEQFPLAHVIWDEELTLAGAPTFALPAADNRACCNSEQKMALLLQQAGFNDIETWTELLEYRWPPQRHFEYQLRSTSRLRLGAVDGSARETVLERLRERLSSCRPDDYLYRGQVILATARKAGHTT